MIVQSLDLVPASVMFGCVDGSLIVRVCVRVRVGEWTDRVNVRGVDAGKQRVKRGYHVCADQLG